jgi:hypothetical protein
MGSRNVRDPLLAIEFLSLTFACASSPSPEMSNDATSSTTQPDPEDTSGVDEYIPEWGLDGYGYDAYISNCDVFAQDCPAGEKCVPIRDDDGYFRRVMCAPVLGDQKAGQPCTVEAPEWGLDDCDALNMCWFVEGEAGLCAPLCSGTADNPTCPDERMCFHTAMDWELFVCVQPCNPILQDCLDGQACHWSEAGFGCSPSNDVYPMDPCPSDPFDCAAGSICVPADALGDNCVADSCCAAWCELTVPEICDIHPGTMCTSFWGGDEPLSPELANLGVCLVP